MALRKPREGMKIKSPLKQHNDAISAGMTSTPLPHYLVAAGTAKKTPQQLPGVPGQAAGGPNTHENSSEYVSLEKGSGPAVLPGIRPRNRGLRGDDRHWPGPDYGTYVNRSYSVNRHPVVSRQMPTIAPGK
jgi:hypothetical protein